MAATATCSAGVLTWTKSAQPCTAQGNQKLQAISSKGDWKCNASGRENIVLNCHQFTSKKKRHRLSCNVLAATSVEITKRVFPSFLPSGVQFLKELAAQELAYRIQQVPVETSLSSQAILTSCVISKSGRSKLPILLLHGFDSSVLEWRRLFPLLEAGEVQTYAVDILGWGFNKTEGVSSFGVEAKREHLYQFWKTNINRPVVLVGASLGGSVAIDFAVTHPDAVQKLVLLNAQGFAEGVGTMATVPKFLAYTGIALLKSVPLRFYALYLGFYKTTIQAMLDDLRVGRLHCLLPGWADSSVSFMLSGGYDVASKVPQVQQETLVIWGEEDKILPKMYVERFLKELPKSHLLYVKEAGHLPHLEKPQTVADAIVKFTENA